MHPPFYHIVMEIEGKSRNSTFQFRPPFSWDTSSVSWTDGRGDQQGYAKAVRGLCAFYDNLSEDNSNKIDKYSRTVFLLYNLYGCVADMCEWIGEKVLGSDNEVELIVSHINKCDALFAVSKVYKELRTFLANRRYRNES